MIVEERIYTLQPGTTAEYLRLYEAEGMAIQVPILGRMEIGRASCRERV